MITIRQSVVALILAGSLYLVGTNVRFSLNGTTASNPLYAQAPSATSAEEQELIEGAEKLSKAFRVAAGKVRPAVVRINSLVRQNSRRRSAEEIPGIPEEFRGFFGEDLFREFENRNQRRGQNSPRSDEEQGELQTAGVGSGVIVSTDGYILTNNHVVDGAEQLEVELSDGRTLSGKVIGTDDKSDVAVIKIDASGLIAARLGDSNQMDVGDWVIAVGSPFELDQTVTAGIISATNRSVEILDYEDFLQTDAAINPGNSGGPLVNLRGEVIGINTAINSRSGSNAGVGFAIPSSMARLIMDNLIENGRVVRGFIGATLETVSPEIVKEYKLGEPSLRGVLVQGLAKDGPAARAGLKEGDVILRLDGQTVRTSPAVRNRVSLTRPGKTVHVDVKRGKQELSLDIKVEELTNERIAEFNGRIDIEGLGISIGNLTPPVAKKLGVSPDTPGAVVLDVKPGTGARLGLAVGDIIREVNGSEITRPEQVAAELKSNQRGLRMLIQRGRQLLSLRIGG